MEFFLLFVLIVLVIIFHVTHNSKFTRLHEHINLLQKQLNDALKDKIVVTPKQEETTKTVVPPVIKEEEKIIKEEEKNKEDEKVVPPVIIEQKKDEEPVKVNIPVIEQPQVKINKPPVVITPEVSWWDKFKERNPDLEKFIGENLLSKIAITILVLGIAFFVKYAIDQNWINEVARVGIGVLCGGIVMGFAHKLRLKFKPFSSVLVAGAIAIFYFTIGIGFHEYHLFSQTVAFIIMTVITGFAVFISVAYDRVELAALAITGGFAVPFMLSTGQGNYKVLFSYILILDIGMLVLAYIKKWNLINILAYAFTILLYCAWLGSKVLGQEYPPYKGAFFFGLIFYITFVLMNVINNIKERRQFTYVELIILISNTFVFYASGMIILHEWMPQYKGVYTIAMAAVNFILAIALYKYFKADKKLVYLLIGMTLTFATLAAPVQLKGNYITLFWGAEAALLIWLSQRSQMWAFKLASVIVSLLMFFSLVWDYVNIYGYTPDGLAPLTNKGFITGMSSALFVFLGSFLLKREKEDPEIKQGIDPHVYGNILRVAGIFITYLTGFLEVHQQSVSYISEQNSIVAVSCFYHVTFTSILSVLLLWRYNAANNVVAFILLCINFLYFSLIYSIAPYKEMAERSRGEHDLTVAYTVHFIALIALATQVIMTIRTAIKQNNFIITAKSALLWVFGIFTILVLSNEAILNTMMIKLHDFKRIDEPYIVSDVFDYVHEQVVKVALPILWGVIAFVFLSVGIRKQLKQLRVMALVILAITLIKLFAYDINDVSKAGKIIAFIILGIVLLIMSFMYQKIRTIIVDEIKPEEDLSTNKTISDETKTD
ncbi:MAG: hypothetical protein K0S32_126 [Bacteroidetes bacterium]|nr:hypothetical protein [Bacteroidota bacterium]